MGLPSDKRLPDTLVNIVVDYIASNLKDVCILHHHPENESSKLVFRDPNAFVASNTGNLLLEKIDQKGELDDLVMTLFDPSVFQLTKLNVHDASHISYSSLQILKYYSLTSVKFWGLRYISVDDLILSFSDYTLNNLVCLCLKRSFFRLNNSTLTCEEKVDKRELHHSNLLVRKSNFWSENVGPQRDRSSFQKLDINAYGKLCKLESIRVLELSETAIESSSLYKICCTFHNLISLDISNNINITSIGYLKYCKDSLKSLNLYNLKIWDLKETLEVLLDLQNLVHIDISQLKVSHDGGIPNSVVPDLLRNPNFVPHAASVDISKQESVNARDFLSFLKIHTNLSFMGLIGMNFDLGEVFGLLPSQCFVTSLTSVDHLLNGLQRYSGRNRYIRKILMELNDMAPHLQSPRPDIVQMIISTMNEKKFSIYVQLLGLTCLGNLVKGDFETNIHLGILKRVVSTTLAAMNEFVHDLRIQLQALRVLRINFIFENVNFDKILCMKLVMTCFLRYDAPLSDRMCVTLFVRFSVKMYLIRVFPQDVLNCYMKKLIKLAHYNLETDIDELVRTATALSHLTEESPAFCELFLAERGLELCQEIFRLSPSDTDVIIEVVTLLKNISSIQDLRKCLMKDEIATMLREFLWFGYFEVSFYAAGILADLVCEENWLTDMKMLREEVLIEIGEVVMKWEVPSKEVSTYQTLKDFTSLLKAFDAPQVQLLAVWILLNLTATNGSKYCPMIVKEGLDDQLRLLIHTRETDEYTRRIAEDILKSLPDSTTEKMEAIDTLIS